jgi:hypothetical protein
MVSPCREFEGPEAGIIGRLVIHAEGFIQVLNKLVDGEGSVVGLLHRNIGTSVINTVTAYFNDGIRDFGTGNDRVRAHHSIRVRFSDFRNQEGTIPAPVPSPSE